MFDPTQQTGAGSNVQSNALFYYPTPYSYTARRQWQERAANSTEFQPGRREHHLRGPTPAECLPEITGYAAVTIRIPVLRCEPSAAALEFYQNSQHARDCFPYGFYAQNEESEVAHRQFPTNLPIVEIQPLRPMATQPMLSQDVRVWEKQAREMQAQEMQAQEIRAQEIRAQEIRAQEIRAQEIRAQEIRAQEIRAQEIRAQEIRAQEIRAQEIRVQNLRAQEAQIREMHSREMHAQKVRAQEIRAQEMRAQKMRAQEIHAQEMRAQEVRAQEVRAQENDEQDYDEQDYDDQEYDEQEYDEQDYDGQEDHAQENHAQEARAQENHDQKNHDQENHDQENDDPENDDKENQNKKIQNKKIHGQKIHGQKIHGQKVFREKVFHAALSQNAPSKATSSPVDQRHNRPDDELSVALSEHVDETPVDTSAAVIIKDADARKNAEFQSVPKHLSFDQANLSEKAKEAMQCAINELKRSRDLAKEKLKVLDKAAPSAIGETESVSVKVQPQSAHDDSEQVQSGTDEPCSSSSIRPVPQSGETTQKTEHSSKRKANKKKKNKKKKNAKVEKEDDEQVFEDAFIYNMKLQMDLYFKVRLEVRQNQLVPFEHTEETQLYTLEKTLINHARVLEGEPDVKLKEEFCRQVLSDLPTMEIDKPEDRQKLTRMFKIFTERNDEILIIDSAFLSAVMANSDERPAELLLLYCLSSCEHTCDQKDLTACRNNAAARMRKITAYKPTNPMDPRVDRYYDLRRVAAIAKFLPTKSENEANFSVFERALYQNFLDASEPLTERDIQFKNTVCRVLIHQLKEWELPEDIQTVLADFYTYLITRSDDILLRDVVVLNSMFSHENPPEFFYYYYQLCVRTLPC